MNSSTHEDMFEEWAKEAMAHGLISDYTRKPEAFEILGAANISVKKQLKTKAVVSQKNILHGIKYYPDFVLLIKGKLHPKLFSNIDETPSLPLGQMFAHYEESLWDDDLHVVYVDVKGAKNRFGMSESDVTFPLKQKMVFDKFNRYINKVVLFPDKEKGPADGMLFNETFIPASLVPDMYYKDNGTRKGARRFQKMNYKTINEFLKDSFTETLF